MDNGYGMDYGFYNSPETSVACVQATVMFFDNETKRWTAADASYGQGVTGFSKVQILRSTQNNTFRVAAFRPDTNQVSLSCRLTRDLAYNRATPVFHQWKVDGQIFGLHFRSEAEAGDFASAVESALNRLNSYASAAPEYNPAGYSDLISADSSNDRPTLKMPSSATTTTTTMSTPEQTAVTTTTTSAAAAAAESDSAAAATTTASPSSPSDTAAAAAAATPTKSVTSPKYQSSFKFVPKFAPTTTAAAISNGFAPSSTSYFTDTASGRVTNEPADYARGGINYVSYQPREVINHHSSISDAAPTPVTPSASAAEPYTAAEVPAAEPYTAAAASPPPVAAEPSSITPLTGEQSTLTPQTATPPTIIAPAVLPPTPPSAPPPSQDTPSSSQCCPPPPPPPPPPPAPPAMAYLGARRPSLDLGSALLGAQLRKSPRPDEEPGGGSLVRSASPSLCDLQSDMMSEMARKLKERKARAATNSPAPAPAAAPTAAGSTPTQLDPVSLQERRPSFDRSRSPIPFLPSSATNKPPTNSPGTESPKFPRSKRIQSLTGQENVATSPGGGGSSSQGNHVTMAELEAVKQELMSHVRTEITKAKQEIIDAVRLLLMSKQ